MGYDRTTGDPWDKVGMRWYEVGGHEYCGQWWISIAKFAEVDGGIPMESLRLMVREVKSRWKTT
jgi:hypothetical protein